MCHEANFEQLGILLSGEHSPPSIRFELNHCIVYLSVLVDITKLSL